MSQPAVPSPRPQPDQTFDLLGKPQTVVSPFDARVRLHIESPMDAFIEYHSDAPAFAVVLMEQLAGRRGYEVDDDHDPIWDDVSVAPLTWRRYLVSIETMPDLEEDFELMPDLNLTAYGPMSGMMEAV